jgi:hypothetical protein
MNCHTSRYLQLSKAPLLYLVHAFRELCRQISSAQVNIA